jgi:hypothetical protein
MPANPTPRAPFPWLMRLWLACCVIVIGFALLSYFAGWFYTPIE